MFAGRICGLDAPGRTRRERRRRALGFGRRRVRAGRLVHDVHLPRGRGGVRAGLTVAHRQRRLPASPVDVAPAGRLDGDGRPGVHQVPARRGRGGLGGGAVRDRAGAPRLPDLAYQPCRTLVDARARGRRRARPHHPEPDPPAGRPGQAPHRRGVVGVRRARRPADRRGAARRGHAHTRRRRRLGRGVRRIQHVRRVRRLLRLRHHRDRLRADPRAHHPYLPAASPRHRCGAACWSFSRPRWR